MNKVNKDYLELIIIFIISIIFWYMAMYYSQSINDYYNSVSVRYNNETISVYDIKQAVINNKKINNKAFQAVLWKVKKNEKIETDIIDDEIKVNIIEIYGDVFEAIPSDLLYGTYNLNKGYNECIIDYNTAYSLFKDKNIIGNKIKCNDKEYLINGVIKTSEKVIIINSDETEIFDNMELIFQNSDNGMLDAENFIKENNFVNPESIIDFPFVSSELIKLSLIPALIIILIIFMKFMKFLNRVKQFPILFIISFIIFLIIFSFIILIIKSEFQFSERFIPTKWSDFDFWINKYNNIMKNIKELMYIKPSPHEIIFNLLAVKYIVCIILASLMIFISEKYILKLNWFELFLTEIIIILINYCVTIKFTELNIIIDFSLVFWIIIPLYIFVRYIYDYMNFSKKDDYY